MACTYSGFCSRARSQTCGPSGWLQAWPVVSFSVNTPCCTSFPREWRLPLPVSAALRWCWPCCRSSASESYTDTTLSAQEDSASEAEESEQPERPPSAVHLPATGKRKRGEGAASQKPKGSAGPVPQKQGPEAKTTKKKNRPGQRARRQHGALAQQGWGRVQSGLKRFQQVTWGAPLKSICAAKRTSPAQHLF